jgi:hypothetical protein
MFKNNAVDLAGIPWASHADIRALRLHHDEQENAEVGLDGISGGMKIIDLPQGTTVADLPRVQEIVRAHFHNRSTRPVRWSGRYCPILLGCGTTEALSSSAKTLGQCLTK